MATPDTPPNPQKSSSTKWLFILIALALLCASGYYAFFLKSGTVKNEATASSSKKPTADRVVSVAVAKVQQGDINLFFQGLGTVTALSNVTVKSRIDGQLIDLFFNEGAMVKEGDILAKIDSRSFEAQLKQAQGQLLKDQALLENALIDLKRYEVLRQQDSISKQVLDTQNALVRQYQGVIKVDEALIESAKLQIEYSTIKAPTSGRIGLRLLDKGNMVRTSDINGLAVITQIDPIGAVFTIPEDKIPTLMQALNEKKALLVEAFDRSNSVLIAEGELLSVDNQIDTATGTLKLKAKFSNSPMKLFPNQFVNIHLLVDTKQNALYVPAAAIWHTTQGKFVYRVKPDQTVSIQRVKIGITENGKTIIEDGLTLEDKVVIDGLDKLREGSKIAVFDDKNQTKRNKQ